MEKSNDKAKAKRHKTLQVNLGQFSSVFYFYSSKFISKQEVLKIISTLLHLLVLSLPSGATLAHTTL